MKSLHLVLVFFAVTAVAVAQRPSSSDSHSSPAPSSSAASSPRAPSSMSSGGGAPQSHSAPASSGGASQSHAAASGSSGGGGSARSNGGNSSGGGRADMGGGRNAGGAAHSNGSGATRSDHNFNGTRTNAPSNDRHGAPASNATKPEIFHGRNGDVSRAGKQPAGGDIVNETRRDHKGEFQGAGKPVDHNSATGETHAPKHFHWFWQKRKDDGQKELAGAGHPELKKPTPCKGNNCKPECPSGQRAGERGGCVPITPIHVTCDGTLDSRGNCILNEPCSNNGVYNPNCPQYANQLSRRPDCSSQASQLALLRHEIEVLRQREQLVCAQYPNGPICRDVREELRRAEEQLMEMERQYQHCQSTRTQFP